MLIHCYSTVGSQARSSYSHKLSLHAMASNNFYSVAEALNVIIHDDDCGFSSSGESEIEEDPAFPLPRESYSSSSEDESAVDHTAGKK